MTENFQNNRKVPTVKGLKADANSRGLKGYFRLNKAELADLMNPVNESVPEINVPILTPQPVNKVERLKQHATDKEAVKKRRLTS